MDIHSNISEVTKTITAIRDQTPFAMAQAVNKTAEDVQNFEYTQQVPRSLTIRNQWSAPRNKLGINRSFATKDSPQASVYSRAPWLGPAEEGATLKAKKSFRIIPIVGGARPTMLDPVDPRLKPNKAMVQDLIARNAKRYWRVVAANSRRAARNAKNRAAGLGSFFDEQMQEDVGKWDGIPFFHRKFKGVFMRVGNKLKMLFSKAPTAKEEPRLDFEKTGQQMAVQRYREHFKEEFKKALQTAR